MTIKEKILTLFESNKGIYLSGEEIAQKLGVSRTAVWKTVKALRGAGYAIDAVTHKGYALSVNNDILSPQGIREYLQNDCQGLELNVLASTDSTNSDVRKKACCGFQEGYTVISNEQTAGRGRNGRSFYSPSDTGIYMSMLLRPQYTNALQSVGITTMAAVAMCDAIEDVSDQKPKIKWVNDIFIHDKKVCGILTEGSFHMESGALEYAILGIGVNVYFPSEGFPEDLKSIAGAIFDVRKNDVKNQLIASFLNHFMCYYQKQNDYKEKYRSYSMVVGKEITVIGANGNQNAIAVGIDSACRLIVRYDDGETGRLSWGEIKIKLSQ